MIESVESSRVGALAFLLLAMLGGCAAGAPPESAEAFAQGVDGTYVYRCQGDERFTGAIQGDSARVRRNTWAATLPRVEDAAGVRYSRGGVTFWVRSTEAGLEAPADTLTGCVGTLAATPWEVSRLLGYDLRGIGQEPGWMVEVDIDRHMHVLADYGEVEFLTGTPEIRSSPDGGAAYAAESDLGEVLVEVRSEGCVDIMSGESFPMRVTLRFDGRLLEGCGRRLR